MKDKNQESTLQESEEKHPTTTPQHQTRAPGPFPRVEVVLCCRPPQSWAASVRLPAQCPPPRRWRHQGHKRQEAEPGKRRGWRFRMISAMRKAPSPPRRGPCRQVCLARQPIHLQKSGSHPERRGKGKFPTPRHPPPSLPLIQTQSAGDSTRALQAPSRSQPERASSPWAQRGTRARAPAALFPATVAGRLAPLQGKGEGRMTGKKAEQAAWEALTFVRKAPPLEEEKERLPG